MKRLPLFMRSFGSYDSATARYWRHSFRNDVMGMIAEVMEEKGWNQSDLARHLGVTRSHVSRLVNWQVNFSMDTLVDLAIRLGRAPFFRDRSLEEVRTLWDHDPAIVERAQGVDPAASGTADGGAGTESTEPGWKPPPIGTDPVVDLLLSGD